MRIDFGPRALAFSAAAMLYAGAASAQEQAVVGYQLIVGPFLTAIADGSFDAALEEAGYSVDWRQFTSGGDISTALASGDVPVGVLGSTGLASAVSRGLDLELFWILDNIGRSEALVAREGSEIQSPEDLAGKSVAVPAVSTAHFHLLVALQDLWGMNTRDVNILNMQPPQIVAAWQRGDIDAAYVWPPAMTEILKTGTIIADSEEIGAATVPTFDGIVADRQWAEDNPEFMTAFTRVLAEAYADYAANGANWTAESPEIQNIVGLIGGDPADVAEAMSLLGFPTLEEQLSEEWLGGESEGGAVRALATSAEFLEAQRQIDGVLDDYSPHVNAGHAQAVAE